MMSLFTLIPTCIIVLFLLAAATMVPSPDIFSSRAVSLGGSSFHTPTNNHPRGSSHGEYHPRDPDLMWNTESRTADVDNKASIVTQRRRRLISFTKKSVKLTQTKTTTTTTTNIKKPTPKPTTAHTSKKPTPKPSKARSKPSLKPSMQKPVMIITRKPTIRPNKPTTRPTVKFVRPTLQPTRHHATLKPFFTPTLAPVPTLPHVGKLSPFSNTLGGTIPESIQISFGSALSLSDNGQFLAAGDFGRDRVFVYQWSNKTLSWIPFGKAPVNVTVQFVNAIDFSTQALAQIILSGNGQVMAVDGVFYRYQSNQQVWEQDDVNATANPFAGSKQVAFSSDLTVGALAGNTTTNVYRWNGKTWMPYGNVIHISSPSVSLSSDGTIVALLAATGIKVFQWSQHGNWVPLGAEIQHTTTALSPIALSGTGQRLVMLLASGSLQAFQYNPKLQTWLPVGSGGTFGVDFGLFSLLVSNDGSVITAVTYALTQVFQVTTSKWNQIGNDLLEANAGPYPVAMSADGHILAASNYVPPPSKFPVAVYTYQIEAPHVSPSQKPSQTKKGTVKSPPTFATSKPTLFQPIYLPTAPIPPSPPLTMQPVTPSAASMQWVIKRVVSPKQLGGYIPGTIDVDILFGYKLALNNNGQVLAVSDYGNNIVDVYRFSTTLRQWEPYGIPPKLGARYNDYGNIVLSANGSIMAVNGTIYRLYSNHTWTKDSGKAPFSGSTVVFSSDMNVAVVPGVVVRVYRWNNTMRLWQQYGSVIHLASLFVTLSFNGATIALQTNQNVQVFCLTKNLWTPLGKPIWKSGIAQLGITSDGKRVTTVSLSNTVSSLAFVNVYQYTPSNHQNWKMIGSSSTSVNATVVFTTQQDGHVVAVPFHSLEQLALRVTGGPYDQGPYTVAVSGDGNVVAGSFFVPGIGPTQPLAVFPCQV